VNSERVLDDRVLVLAPTGRDSALTCSLLGSAGIAAENCPDMAAVCAEIARGAAVLMLAEEVLVSASAGSRLSSLLKQQEPWSDLPILLFWGAGATLQTRAPTPGMLEPLGNVALLDRPVRPTTMLTAVRTALRARRRQYAAREALQAERAAVRERDKFLAMLGHELRNPLSPIFVALELMGRGESDTKASKALGVIRRQVKHLARIVDDLLDVSRVTSGKIVLQRSPLDLREAVRRCVQSLAGAVAAQGLTLTFTDGTEGSDPKERLLVDGDPVRLEQVVMNLALNAIKYTPARGHVRISLEREADTAIIRFKDDGVGIPLETLPRVFDLFVQAEQTLDRAKGGMGVGLTLVKNLVELHGGTVGAESEGPGTGSEFVVRLPLCVSAHEAKEEAADVRLPLGDASAPRRVLIIEDNEDSREMLQTLLQTRGHHVDCARDGPSGVERALALRPDVALVDIGLPGMDGYGVARRIREVLGGGVLLVALTGYGQPEDRRLAFDAGFDRHLTKPVKIEAVESIFGQSPSELPVAAGA
jgi:signal transduction histidine kinase/CheY-like chemotaxis protein